MYDDDSDEQLLENTPVVGSSMALDHFKEYVTNAKQNFLELRTDEVTAVRLMHTLMRKKATLDTYDAVMEWHFQEVGELCEHEQLGDTRSYLSRTVLLKKLTECYNMDHKQLVLKEEIILPSCRAKANIVWRHARECVISILTDPRLDGDEFLILQ